MTTVPAGEPAGPLRRLPTGQMVLGALLVVGGLLWLLETIDVLDVSWDVVFPAALIVIGAALMIATRRNGRGGLITVGVILTIVTVGISALDFPLRGGAGERTFRPASVGDLARDYHLAFGQLTLDLTALDLPSGTTRVEASVGFGELVVELPEGVPVEVEGTASAGEVRLVRASESGLDVDAGFVDDGYASAETGLALDLSVGFGEITVRR
jgi:hypothetical protein